MPLLIDTKRALLRKQTYIKKVLGYSPIAYWVQGEKTGTAARCYVNPAQNGTYTGVTLGQPGIGDGQTSPFYDGANDYTNIYSATFDGAFNGGEGTVMCWGMASGVGIWTDGLQRNSVRVAVDANNGVQIYKAVANNRITFAYTAGGVGEVVFLDGVTETEWMALAVTWSVSAGATGEFIAYYNGTQTGATQVALGVWAGALHPARTVIGAATTVPLTPWSGRLAHCAVWDRALTPAGIADLAVP